MKNLLKKPERTTVLITLLLIIIISGFTNIFYLLRIPADPKHAVLMGYSANRLILLSFLSFGVLGFTYIFIRLQKSPNKTLTFFNRIANSSIYINLAYIFLVGITFVTWLAFFSPTYFLGKYYSSFNRLRPILVWIQTICTAAIFQIMFFNFSDQKEKSSFDSQYTKILVLIFSIFLFVFLLTYIYYPKLTNDPWVGTAKVPILSIQIFISWALTSSILLFSSHRNNKTLRFFHKHSDIFIFISIWIIAALLWVNQPIEFRYDSYFTATGQHIRPLPPDNEIFPWKDSRTYFHITELIKTGNGFDRSIDKSLFLAVQSVNNWFSGGSYEKMLDLQVWILALFPPMIYLLGKELHSRLAGLLGATLAVLQEINGLHLIDEFPVVSSKVLLSEPYMQLWTVLIALITIIALKKSSKTTNNFFLAAGGVLGLSALFRLNTLVIIPFILIIFLFHLRGSWQKIVRTTVIFLIGILIALTPWMIYNTVKYENPFAFIRGKVKGVIINNRYEDITGKIDPQTSNPESDSDHLQIFKERELPITLSSFIPEFNLPDNTELERSLTLLSGSDSYSTIISGSENEASVLIVNQNRQSKISGDLYPIMLSVLRHFMNNIITSYSILPTSADPQDLFHGSRNQQFWGSYDENLFERINPFVILVNLLIISTGISSAVRKHKCTSLIPAAILLGYHLSNGIAVSSGHRYSQPVAWVVFFYYSLGLISISQWFITQLHPDQILSDAVKTSNQSQKYTLQESRIITWLLVGAIICVGSAPIAADLLPVKRFPELDDSQIFSILMQDQVCRETLHTYGYTDSDIQLISNRKNGNQLSIGRILEPLLLNGEEFHQIFPNSKNNIGESEPLFSFFFLDPKSDKLSLQQMLFYPHKNNIPITHGTDAVIIRSNKANVKIIGIITPEYSQNISSYKDLASIPINCFVAANH